MILARLLGLGLAYGVGFALIKSLFPTPIVLLVLQEGGGNEGNYTTLVFVYMAVGVIGGLVAAPLLGGILLAGRGSGSSWLPNSRLTLSLVLALIMGVVSGVLILLAYATGILPGGGVLDPWKLIDRSNFAPGTPLLFAWTIARDLLPAGLTGLFLSPVGGSVLQRLRTGDGMPEQKQYDWGE